MGISNRAHFAWLRRGIERFEAETGRLATLRARQPAPVVWCLSAQTPDPATELIRETLGADRTQLRCFDKFPANADVQPFDLNRLDELPAHGADVITLFRAVMYVRDPAPFLVNLRRILRPGGIVLIDWLNGLSNAPVLDLRGDPRHGGVSTPFATTYVDPVFLTEFAREFDKLIAHVNRPPATANVDQPGVPVPFAERWRRWTGRGPRRSVCLSTYIDVMREEMRSSGKQLIEPSLLEQEFDVLFRDARYFYPDVRKFNLYLLTVLQAAQRR